MTKEKQIHRQKSRSFGMNLKTVQSQEDSAKRAKKNCGTEHMFLKHGAKALVVNTNKQNNKQTSAALD